MKADAMVGEVYLAVPALNCGWDRKLGELNVWIEMKSLSSKLLFRYVP